MSKNKKALGTLGEKIAANYLSKYGYKIIESNYRCRFGEVDIVAYKNDTYVFIEVKTRKNLSFGRPVEAINGKKKMHLIKIGQYYMQISNLKNCDFRFDAIEVMMYPREIPKINHIKNIMQ